MTYEILFDEEYSEKISALIKYTELDSAEELFHKAIDTMFDVIEVECNGEGKIYL